MIRVQKNFFTKIMNYLINVHSCNMVNLTEHQAKQLNCMPIAIG